MKKNPFNWVGNKYKYVKNINEIIKGKYENVYDVFMGSGNIIVNLDCSANLFIGNDIIPLLPNLYNVIKKQEKFTKVELDEIINKWKFTDKAHYYYFRDHWNKKYLFDNYDRKFIYETILLLKMCSNSMVRFNRKHRYFNQGFRGISKGRKEFFTPMAKDKIVRELNDFRTKLQENTFEFHNKDFKDLLLLVNKGDLVLLDPPYILSEGMYGADFTKEDDQYIFDFLSTTEADFVYFNYLESGDEINKELQEFLDKEDFNVEVISERSATGQNKKNVKSICEIMVSNMDIKEEFNLFSMK